MGSILPLVLEDIVLEIDGRRLLDGVGFELEQGGRSLLLGANGAGKSLSLRIAHGLLAPTGGTVRWCGPAAAEARRRQAMVFQRPVHLRRSTRANVEYALALRGLSRGERRRRADEILERTGLASLARQPARSLSAGEQQRLALARAWVLEPEVMFLDEPTAALDPSATRAVELLIDSIAAAGTKILMTTHDLAQARRLADDVLFLHRGALIERAPAKIFFDEPESPEAAAFLAGELVW